MFVTVELNEEIAINTAVNYNAETQKWIIANNTSQVIGVVKSTFKTDDEKWMGRVGISGLDCYMIADREIPVDGGFMHVQNGRVYVDNSSMGCGIISPQNIGEASRNANDLILVHLR